MATNQRNSLLDDGTSEATKNFQPSKDMNAGSATINWANPESPSTNNATRREEYNIKKQWELAWADSIKNTLDGSKIITEPTVVWPSMDLEKIETPTPKKTNDFNLDMSWNFDSYTPLAVENMSEQMKWLVDSASKSLNKSLDQISSYKLASENFQYETWSSNVAKINSIIKQIQKAYTAGIYDSATIASQLGVDENVIKTIQQWKASDLVTLGKEYMEDNLKSFFRAEEDYNTQLTRTIQSYQLASTNLEQTYASNMQRLKRSLFNDARQASVSSAVAWVSGSQYMVDSLEAQYRQNMDDLNNGFMYSSLTMRQNYVNALEDYNRNMERLGEDFDSAVEAIQKSVLQQFQELDNKVGLAIDDYETALNKINTDSTTKMSDALKYFYQAMASWHMDEAKIIAQMNWLDTSAFGWETSVNAVDNLNKFTTTYQDLIASWWKIRKWWCGEPVNDYLKYFGSDLQISQAKDLAPYAKDKYPTEWAIVYFDWTQSRATENTKKYWHTWIVAAVNPEKGTITVLDSNWATKMWLGYTEYKMSDATWYYTPKWSATSTDWTDWWKETDYSKWWYRDRDIPNYEIFLQKWEKSAFTDKGRLAIAKEYWTFENFKEAAYNYKREAAKAPISTMQSNIDDLTELKTLYNELTESERNTLRNVDFTEWDDWSIIRTYTKWKALSEKQQRVVNLFAQAKWRAFIEMIIDSKQRWATYWALSDKEWGDLRKAASHLNLNTPSYFIWDLDEMIWNIQANIDELNYTPWSKWDSEQNTSTNKWTNILKWLLNLMAKTPIIKTWNETFGTGNWQFNATSERMWWQVLTGTTANKWWFNPGF